MGREIPLESRPACRTAPPVLSRIKVWRRAGQPGDSGSKGFLAMTDSALAVLVAAALSLSIVVPAYGQTTETPAQTTTPTETTPTETTPTETTPAPTSPEPTSAPNEYVESIPTGGGQSPDHRRAGDPAPSSGGSRSHAGDHARRTPVQPAEAAPNPPKRHKKKQQARPPAAAPARDPDASAAPAQPARAQHRRRRGRRRAGEPAAARLRAPPDHGRVLGTAVANRQRAGA